jgi:hypothetical protein
MNGVDRIGAAVLCALALGAASTAGDFIWANFITAHRVVYGLVHGMLILAAVGACLGTLVRRASAGALGGALIGLGAAGSFYLLSQFVGFAAMFFIWFAMWIAFAALEGRVLERHMPMRDIVVRGLAAGVGSGSAFYAVSGIWRPFNPQGWDYLVHFLSWTIAYLPAFLALLVRKPATVKLRN